MANVTVIASAGSGKTTRLIDEVSTHPADRILITTYTNENAENIRERLIRRFGCIPPKVTVSTWYSVLLTHGVKPYYNLVSNVPLARSIALVDLPLSLRAVPKSEIDRYFFTKAGNVYRDRVSDFVCLVDETTGGRVLRRLAGVFTRILIDEIQDLNGYDLDLLEKVFRSPIEVVGVGDPRQCTFVTNHSRRNRGVARARIVEWLENLEQKGLVRIERNTDSWRSNQEICDFADSLYPHLPRTTSCNAEITGHDGVFQITSAEAVGYFASHQPVVLRWNRNSNTLGLPAMNIGLSKGRTFDRVMIFPTKPMKDYLGSRDVSVAGDLAKFYVAVTRARYSVTFVL